MSEWYTTGAVPPLGYCPYCSNPEIKYYIVHNGQCPKIKAIEYDPQGNIKRVVFKEDNNE